MRQAFALAGQWFFGTVIALYVVFPRRYRDLEMSEKLLNLFVVGFVVAGFVFFFAWYNIQEEERRLRDEERRDALRKSHDEDA